MDVVQSNLPLYACMVSLVATIPIGLSRRHPNLRETWTLIAAVVMLGMVLAMLPEIRDGRILQRTLIELVPGVAIEFRVDGLGLLFALVASTLWIVTSIYSIGYMRGLKEHAQTRFFLFFAISLSATLGVAFAGNLLTMYLFYEILSLSTYPLVTHHQDRSARTGGRIYLTYLLGTSIAFALPAMVYAYLKSGGVMDFSTGGFLSGRVGAGEALVLLLLFVFGFAKAGLMPFHSWLPGAMVAPTPVSALLHAVAVVKVGVFCVIRVFTGVFGFDFLRSIGVGEVITWIAGVTIIVASLIALTQDNLKRRLAFSTIGQLAYIVMGVSLLSPYGLLGSVLHIGTHAMGKITLFFCAGAILVASGKKNVSELDGIGRRMPFTMFAFLLASLSIIGLPPMGGAWSKWFLFLGSLEAGKLMPLLVLIVSSLLNIAYLLPVIARAFFRNPEGADGTNNAGRWEIQEAPAACVVSLSLTALGCFALFVFPDILLDLASVFEGQL